MATLHRFRDSVALSLSGPGSTRYMSAATARDMAAALIKAADSIAQERFTDSGCLDWSGPDHADATAAGKAEEPAPAENPDQWAAVASAFLSLVGPRKVRVSSAGVALFNARWPGSSLRSSRAYWFEFDSGGDLIDTDCPERDDGPAAAALADDCKAWLQDDTAPEWLP